MMCLCENNRIESWQIQMGENETLRFLLLHMVHNIACVMLKQHFFEIETTVADPGPLMLGVLDSGHRQSMYYRH